MYNIEYTKIAKENIVDIFGFISDDNAFYAAKVIHNIKNTIDILKMFPNSGKSITKDIKIIIESRYKYKVVYTIQGETIYIISIFKYQNMWE